MPTFKLTTIFATASAVSTPGFAGRRTGSFTESWYLTADTAGQVYLQASMGGAGQNPGLWQTRAQLLGQGAGIVGYRIQAVSPPGSTQSGLINYPGPGTIKQDVPQMALLVRIPGLGVNNIRRIKLKGIPDIEAIEGEYQPDASFTTAFNSWAAVLSVWQFRGRDLSQPINKIVSVSATGVVTFENNVSYTLLQFVRVLRTQDASGNLRGGRYQVTTLGPGGNVVTLGNWQWGATKGGSARLDGVVYPFANPAAIGTPKLVVAKVGAPFFRYRGRRSRRR